MEIVIRYIKDPIPSICQLRPDLPADYDLVIDEAMAKDPNDRFAKANTFSTAVSALASGEQPSLPLPAQSGTISTAALSSTSPSSVRHGSSERVRTVLVQPVADQSAVTSKQGDSKIRIWLMVLAGLFGCSMLAIIAITAVVPFFQNQDTQSPTDTAAIAYVEDTPRVEIASTESSSFIKATEKIEPDSGRNDSQMNESVVEPIVVTDVALPTATLTELGPTIAPQLPGVPIVFDSTRDGGAAEIYIINADGSGARRLIKKKIVFKMTNQICHGMVSGSLMKLERTMANG